MANAPPARCLARSEVFLRRPEHQWLQARRPAADSMGADWPATIGMCQLLPPVLCLRLRRHALPWLSSATDEKMFAPKLRPQRSSCFLTRDIPTLGRYLPQLVLRYQCESAWGTQPSVSQSTLSVLPAFCSRRPLSRPPLWSRHGCWQKLTCLWSRIDVTVKLRLKVGTITVFTCAHVYNMRIHIIYILFAYYILHIIYYILHITYGFIYMYV